VFNVQCDAPIPQKHIPRLQKTKASEPILFLIVKVSPVSGPRLGGGPHLLGQVVVDDERVLAVVPEVLAHGAAGVGRQVLQWGGVRSGGRHHNGVAHGVGVRQPLHQLGHGGALLADGHVDAVQLLLLVRAVVEAPLVDDGVDGDRRFAAGRNHNKKGLKVGITEMLTDLNRSDGCSGTVAKITHYWLYKPRLPTQVSIYSFMTFY